MNQLHNHAGDQQARICRRRFLRRFAGTAAFTVAALRHAFAGDGSPLDALIEDTDRGEFGQSFDRASRTIHMPKASVPMLSPQTAEITEQAIKTYDGIIAHGGWPQVPQVDELRLGSQHSAVTDLRARLSVSGDLDPSAVGNDTYNSYVEAAVRRFQARHGLTSDGIVRAPTLIAMNVPAPTRRDQLKINIARLKTLTTNLGPRYVVVNIPAARVEAIENGFAVRGTPRSSASRTGLRPTSTARSSRSISIRTGRCRYRSYART